MSLKRWEGCGDHGETKEPRHRGYTRKKWDPWCIKCNPVPSNRTETPTQKFSRRLKQGRA